MRAVLFPILLLCSILVSAQGTLTVEVELNRPDAGGVLRVVLCGNEASYDSEQECTPRSVAANSAVVSLTFADVAPGTYALKVFHDVDGDGQLDTNMIGIPTEPYGFSNDAMGTFGPPSFEQAGFQVGKAGGKVRLRLKG